MPALLATLVAVLLATKLLGEVAQRVGQPSVLGELLAGILLGGSVLGVLDPAEPVVAALAELGVLVLLFEIGLHTDLRSLARVGKTAITVALVGVALPFSLGFGAAAALGLDTLPSLVAGAALTATSIGISARVLSELGCLETAEGQTVLGAAVLDDILGLVILSVVAAAAGGEQVTLASIGRTAAVALGFVAAALTLGSLTIRPLFRFVERVRTTGTLAIVALAFALGLAALAGTTGSAMLIGAFAAGVILHPTPQRHDIERGVVSLGHFFVPIFFASVGASVDLAAMASPTALAVGAALIVVGVLGKVAAGYAPVWFRGDKLLIGVAMVPRGEVGLIFAQMGLATGAIDGRVFGAIMLMVLVTTFVTPPTLARVARRAGAPRGEPMACETPGGVDDLVVGRERRDAADPAGSGPA